MLMKTPLLLLLAASLIGAGALATQHPDSESGCCDPQNAKCSPTGTCTACSDCSKCKHCKSGGTCSVCKKKDGK
jgi:hypothetical protein